MMQKRPDKKEAEIELIVTPKIFFPDPGGSLTETPEHGYYFICSESTEQKWQKSWTLTLPSIFI